MKVKLELELLADALPGSGESIVSYIDQDVVFDKYGLPYLPSKRIKGVLRVSARDISDLGELQNPVENIFGTDGSSRTAFRISNGYIKNYRNYRDFLKFTEFIDNLKFKSNVSSDIFSQSSIKSYFSYIRTQIAVDRKSGTSQEGSLRIFRILRKGLIFNFVVEINDDYFVDFKKICAITRHFGTARTRGFGEISLKIEKKFNGNQKAPKSELISSNANVKKENENDSNKAQSELLYTIELKLTNKEQLLVSNLISGLQTSELFIRGSYIRGALANFYINKNSIKDPLQDNNFYQIFLSDKVIFSNLYPFRNNKIFFPTPFSIVKEKSTEKYYDLAYEEDKAKIVESEIQTVPVGGYTVIESAKLMSYSLASKIESHHLRPKNRKIGHAKKGDAESKVKTGTFFHYDVLEPNTQFKGKIIGRSGDLKPIVDILPKRMVIYLGKSRTAQYGKCKLIIESYKKSKKPIQLDINQKIVITLLSDMILVNKYGNITPDPRIFLKEFADFFKIKETNIKIKHSFLKFKKVGGFNSKWKFPKMQSQALAAGSVIIIKLQDIEHLEVNNNEPLVFGLRKSEGYGLIDINKHGFSKIEKDIADLDKIYQIIPQNDEMPKDLIDYCISRALKSTLESEAIKKAKSISKSKISKISRSFLQRLLIFANSSKTIQVLNNKLKDLKDNANQKLKMIEKEVFIENENVQFELFKNELFLKILDEKFFNYENIEKFQTNNEIKDYLKKLIGEKTTYLENNNKVIKFYRIYLKFYLTNLILKSKVEIRK